MAKVLYKSASLLAGLAGGIVARSAFRKIWKLAAGQSEAPDATDERYGWGEVLLAAALQGAVFAVVKAAVDRATAEGARKLTGSWPGEGGTARRPEHREAAGTGATCSPCGEGNWAW